MPDIKITWSNEALAILENIFEYIYEEWGVNPVIDLQNELESLIRAIVENKKLCPVSKVKGLRKCMLCNERLNSANGTFSRTNFVHLQKIYYRILPVAADVDHNNFRNLLPDLTSQANCI